MNYLKLLTTEERLFLDGIKDSLASCDEVKTMSVIGSLAKGHYSQNSDIDILVLVQTADFSLEGCKLYAEKAGFHAELRDDAYDHIYNGRNFSLLFKDYEMFLNNISDIMNGGQPDPVFKTWAYGGMITDVLLLDIKNAIVVFDKDGRMADYSDALKKGYPKKLADVLVHYNRDFIDSRLKALRRFSGNPLISELIKGELMTSFIRLVYATKREFNPGLKHIYGDENIPLLRSSMPELIKLTEVYGNIDQLSDFLQKYINGVK